MIKKCKTTYDKFMESLTQQEKEDYKKEYKEFLLSEMLLAAMEEDEVSVRKLARAAGVSPAIIQGLKSKAHKNVTIKNLVKILKALGCSLIVEKDGSRFPINISQNNN